MIFAIKKAFNLCNETTANQPDLPHWMAGYQPIMLKGLLLFCKQTGFVKINFPGNLNYLAFCKGLRTLRLLLNTEFAMSRAGNVVEKRANQAGLNYTRCRLITGLPTR